MKFFHLSDLHLGKRVCERSLIPDQKDILMQILDKIKAETPDAVIIAGDIYDRSIPSEEAVNLFDDFLFELAGLDMKVLVISGNHDSAQRLGFGNRIIKNSGIYISSEFNRQNYSSIIKPVVISDEYGEVNFYLLPFVTPADVRLAVEDTEIKGYTQAVKRVIDDMHIDITKRNVLVSHQFITNSRTCDSETFSIGGTDNIDAEVFKLFDYVALGHLHGGQNVGNGNIRYCGTPLKYSFSEVNHKKSITAVEIGQKGSLNISEIPLAKPLHDWRFIKGSFEQVLQEKTTDDYIKAELTDGFEEINVIGRLREIFPNIMQLSYSCQKTYSDSEFAAKEDIKNISGAELFERFFKHQTNSELTEFQKNIVQEIFKETEEEC